MILRARDVVFVLVAVTLSLAIWGIIWLAKHPCTRSVTHRVWVDQITTYVDTGGGMMNADGEFIPGTGIKVPFTTPAHFEDQTICMERRP
ncbi:MAG TPA: hypothetical protein VK789_09395 [Bryobacteraceae bacterium]|nr:hypothetical protein [Bryobacteraceae bacterium]